MMPFSGLMDQIASLRQFHRNSVVLENRTLDSGFAASLVKRFNFNNESEIQRVWAHFLAPSPWEILQTTSISTVGAFHQVWSSLFSFCEPWRSFGSHQCRRSARWCLPWNIANVGVTEDYLLA